MRTLYPDIQSAHEYRIETSDGHSLYVEESGNPKGIPVLFVHGGPGGGSSPTHRRFFNPERYRIILFDAPGKPRTQHHPGTDR